MGYAKATILRNIVALFPTIIRNGSLDWRLAELKQSSIAMATEQPLSEILIGVNI